MLKGILKLSLIAVSITILISAVPGMQKAKAIKIISGTTIEADINGKVQKVKLIGIGMIKKTEGKQTVEYENEAKRFIQKHIYGKNIMLTRDSKLPDKDKNGNLLRYVYFGQNKFFNQFMIKQGYALTDTSEGFDLVAKFKETEKLAKDSKTGIWSIVFVKQSASGDVTVYISKSGIKYHKQSCRSVKKSSTAIKLKEARAKGYLPCKICKAPA
jgi:endonuclease YncB( thermonuclease family)